MKSKVKSYNSKKKKKKKELPTPKKRKISPKKIKPSSPPPPPILKKRKIKKKKSDPTPIIVPVSSIIKKKRRKKNPTRMYFTQETEEAIINYNDSSSEEIREKIFREKIYFSFQKLVENIYNTFKFSYFETGPQDVQRECLTHLVANIHKYDKEKGKAFSYFSIIAKHYLILLNNTNYKKFNQNIEIGEDREENTVQLQYNDSYQKKLEMNDFLSLMVNFWETNIKKIFTKPRDLNIANAVIELFRNSDRIDSYNKKTLYLYIREMTECKTQQITKVINRMKEYHNDIQESYRETGQINNELFISI